MSGNRTPWKVLPSGWLSHNFNHYPKVFITAVDEGTKGSEWNAEIDAVSNGDGTITILDMRRWRSTIDEDGNAA